MSLMVKQSAFKNFDRSEVFDDEGNVRWYIKRERIALGYNINVYDLENNKVASILQRVTSFNPRFDITVDGKKFATINKVTTMFKPKYDIEGVTWQLDGDFYMHNFKVYSQFGGLVMSQHKQWFTWGDTFIIDYSKQSDELYCLCVALALDAADANSYRFIH